MKATIKLLNAYFWKTYYGPIIAFIFPIILLGILGSIFKVEYVYPGIIAMSILFIGLLALPLAMTELKRSSLFKYIGSSPVNPIKFTLIIILFYVFISFISTIIVLFSTMAIFPNAVFYDHGFKNGILGGIFSSIGSLFFLLSFILHLLFVISFGLAIVTFSKTPQQTLTIGIIIIIPSIFLSGMVLSVDLIGQSKVMQWASRFVPFRYSTGNMIISSTPLNQIGNPLDNMTLDDKHLLFKNVDINGVITLKKVSGERIRVNSIQDLFDLYYKIGNEYQVNANLNDQPLFKLIFREIIEKNKGAIADHNIFNWLKPWAVKRVVSTEQAQNFIIEYFKTFSEDSTGHINWSRLEPLATKIAQGNFGWLNLFIKQTNTLYEIPERVLNIVLPITMSGLLLFYTTKKFEWSVR